MTDIFPISKVKPADTAMELKCVVTVPILRYLQQRYGVEMTRQAVWRTEMNIEYLQNPNNWISFDYHCRLLRELVDVAKDSMAPFEAARLHSDKASFKIVAFFLLHLGSPAMTYKLIVKFNMLWNRISRWKMIELKKNSCVISLSYPNHKQDKNNCLAIQGALAAVPMQYGLPSAKIEEQQCACQGANTCVYRITWRNKPEQLLAWIGCSAGMLLGIAVNLFSHAWEAINFVVMTLLGLIGYFMGRELDYKIKLKTVYSQNEEQAQSLLESIREIEKLNEQLQQKIEQRTAELQKSNEALEKALIELKNSQEKVILAEKQAAIGTLAAGMAHELNSPFNAIRLSIQALKEDMPANEDLRAFIINADRSLTRCRRIIDEVLAFSRDPRNEVDVDIKDTLIESLDIFEKEQTGSVKINRSFQPNLPTLLIDRLQFQQIVFNLLKNASDAMNDKGQIDASLSLENNYITLRVTDYGPGISEPELQKIFDPYFSTKRSSGKGLGLGLSITYQLVKKNSGKLDVISRKDKGATFIVSFPLPEKENQKQLLL